MAGEVLTGRVRIASFIIILYIVAVNMSFIGGINDTFDVFQLMAGLTDFAILAIALSWSGNVLLDAADR